MCTAVTFQSGDHYFGRNLDLEYSYPQVVTVTPRNFPFAFRKERTLHKHYAMIGMSLMENGYPLYFDATNEKGLSMAGLNFPGNAVYQPEKAAMVNIAPFELIPWILSKYASVAEAKKQLQKVNLVNIAFSESYPLSPLHWIISDETESITVEPLEAGLKIYDNPVGILTNNPPFDYHMYNLKNYMHLTREETVNRFSSTLQMQPYSRGMGAIGLPGDLSSGSRFVKAAFTKMNSVSEPSESASISQVFHILGSVAQQQGCVRVGSDYEKTVYTGCCNTTKGIYYYTTYENSQITGIHLHHENLDCDKPITFPLIFHQQIHWEN